MKKRVIAYYLPQFHEVIENNLWWGNGYTEWTAVKDASLYFDGHEIRKPTTLGYYNLLDNSTIQSQFDLAKSHGVDAFCLWTYWFGRGDRILEKPMELILENKLNVDYCIAWANHSWLNKSKNILLKEQLYLGVDDYIDFFNAMLPHFNNVNYIKKDGMPIVTVYNPLDIPDLDIFVNTWNKKAVENGFPGVYFIAESTGDKRNLPNKFFSHMNSQAMYNNRSLLQRFVEKLVRKYRWSFLGPIKYNYPTMMNSVNSNLSDIQIPIIYTGWDTSIRHKKMGVIFDDFNVLNFENHVNEAFSLSNHSDIIFIKSWNEWAEGNILEPDSIHGDNLLKSFKRIREVHGF